MAPECKKCGNKDVGPYGNTANGKKPRYRCKNKECRAIFVVGDGRDKKAGRYDKLLIMLLSQLEEKPSDLQIGALFRMSKQRINEIGKAWPKAEEGVPLEVDLQTISCSILPHRKFKDEINKEIQAHDKSSWIILKFPGKEDRSDTYLLKALEEVGEGVLYRKDEYNEQNEKEPTVRIPRLANFAKALGDPIRVKILITLLQHGPGNTDDINSFMQIVRSSLIQHLKAMVAGRLIYQTTVVPVQYEINWYEFEFFKKVFSKPE